MLLAVMPVAIVGFDLALAGRPTWRVEGATPSRAYRLLPHLYIPAQLALIAWVGWTIAQPAATTLLEAGHGPPPSPAASPPVSSASSRRMRWSTARIPAERAFGLVMLARGALRCSFAIRPPGRPPPPRRHLRGPSARRGEAPTPFLVRSVSGQAAGGPGRFEARAAAAAAPKRPAIGPGNRLILWWFADRVAIVASLSGSGSLCALLAFFLAEAALAIVMLELFNYILRPLRPDAPRVPMTAGRLERPDPQHSWNSARRMNNWSRFNLGRHADHHRFSARPYRALEVRLPGSTELLPAGYAGGDPALPRPAPLGAG